QKFPLPNLNEQLETLSSAKLFCQLDLASGYLQIPLDETSKAKTAFITQDGQYQFERMPFGLTNGPAEFQRVMNMILGDLRNCKVVNYLDDILIPCLSEDDMLNRLRSVFEALAAAGLSLSLRKCHFGVESVEYLGFIIANGKLRPG